VAEPLLLRTGRNLDLYRRLAGARIRSDFEYRTSFALRITSHAAISLLDLLAILFLFRQVDALGGWSAAEVVFLYGLNVSAFAMADMAVGNLDGINVHIRTGRFDQLLTRPASPLVFLAGDEFALRRMGQLLQGVVVFAVGVIGLGRAWSAADVALAGLALAAGAVIYTCVFVLSASAIFWLLEGREVVNSFIYGGRFLSQYPLTVFGTWTRRAAVYVLPIGFVAYLPAVTLLGKDDPLPPWAGWLAPLVALALVAVTAVAWRGAVRAYRSTGS
jgi:ABC-2 type transport system permease protein